VLRDATIASPGVALKRIQVHKNLVSGGIITDFGRQRTNSKLASSSPPARVRTASSALLENIVIRAGEGVALNTSVYQRSVPLKISATLIRTGSPNRTFMTSYVTSVSTPDVAIFAVNNQAGSGETILLQNLSVEEVGTLDSPYFQVVPISLIDPDASADTSKYPQVLKMDSDYPSPASWIKVVSDAPVFPVGMPENALADSSAGSPKGFNYFKTKDFLGPVYRTLFPEQIAVGSIDTFGYAVGMKNTDVFARRAGIVIREGEGIALVSGAETATITSAVGVSGWSSWEFGIIIDIEPKISPTLTITGLKNPSEVRIFDAGTTTQLAGQENVTSGTFQWVFDPETYPSVDIAILSLGYQNVRFTSFPLSLADTSIPVQQQVDRQYENS
jgi:hypothetical protein